MTRSPNMQTTRREFFRSAAVFGGLALFSRTLAACALGGDARGEAAASSSDELVSCAPVIGNNHGHVLVVSADDVAAGVEKTYSIQGTSRHNHLVTLTAANFAALRAGQPVTVVSSNDAAHAHTVNVSCADDAHGSDAGTSLDASRTCQGGATADSITLNHGHSLSVPKGDVDAGVARTYSIQGTSTHPHDVTLTEADFAKLRAGQTVRVTSSVVFGHAHDVEVVCA